TCSCASCILSVEDSAISWPEFRGLGQRRWKNSKRIVSRDCGTQQSAASIESTYGNKRKQQLQKHEWRAYEVDELPPDGPHVWRRRTLSRCRTGRSCLGKIPRASRKTASGGSADQVVPE